MSTLVFNLTTIDAAMETALAILRNGGSTGMANRAFRNVLAPAGEHNIFVVWRLDYITVCIEAGDQPLTVVRSVGPIGVNLARANEALHLSQRVSEGDLNANALPEAIVGLQTLAAPYASPLLVLAASVAGAAYSQIPGGDWGAMGIACVAACIGQGTRLLLQARKKPVAMVTLLAGLLSAFIAACGLRIGLSSTAPATLIASVIYLVPGLPLINGFVDIVTHEHIYVGIQRILNAIFIFVILSLDIALAYTVMLAG